jgi:hypothetical protein
VDAELLYLTKRASFHRRMACAAACGEARHAHQALAAAYLRRIDDWNRDSPLRQAKPAAAPDAGKAVLPGPARPEPVE